MAVTTLNIAESIRPWMSAGLQWYLPDNLPVTEPLSLAESLPDASGNSQGNSQSSSLSRTLSDAHSGNAYDKLSGSIAGNTDGNVGGNTPVNDSGNTPDNMPASTGNRNVGVTPTSRTTQSHSSPRAKDDPQTSSIRKEAPLIQPSTLPPDQWPAEWQAMWSKVVPSSPIVWTYWSLGEDLGGKANPKRSNLLKTIISQLHLPKGSNTFWPVAVLRNPQDIASSETSANAVTESSAGSETADKPQTTSVADAPIFLSGIQQIRPKYIITFGSKALHEFAPSSGLGPYMQTQFMGCKLIALPDMDRMIDDMKHVSAIVAYLRTAISIRR